MIYEFKCSGILKSCCIYSGLKVSIIGVYRFLSEPGDPPKFFRKAVMKFDIFRYPVIKAISMMGMLVSSSKDLALSIRAPIK